jgi:mono/diheme cytochrome c family protein
MRRRIFKIVGLILALLVVILIIAVGVVFFLSNNILNKEYDPNVTALTVDIPTDEESIAEGERLFKARLCADCHGGDAGGDNLIDEPIFTSLDAPNLTNGTGGVAGDYEVEDWVRAIRHGVDSEGKSLIIMPSYHYQIMRDEELTNIIAYLENTTPVDNDSNTRSFGLIGRMVLLTNVTEFVSAERVLDTKTDPAVIDVAATPEYGKYLADMACTVCHGDKLEGGTLPGEDTKVPTLNLSNSWTYEQFLTTIREGTLPDGSRLSEDMPWENASFMTDLEFEALWAYIQTLE